jgi:hypothetical protein
MNIEPGTARQTDSDEATLPVVIARLGDDLVRLIDAKLGLLKIEIQEELWAYGRNILVLIAAAVVAVVGFAFANVALAFGLADLLRNTGLSDPWRHALAFAAVGLVSLGTATAAAAKSWDRLSKQEFTPARTLTTLSPEPDKRS